MANAVDNFDVPEGDDLEMSEAEIKTIEGELNELLNPTNGDDKEESCLSLSAQLLEEQPDVTQIIESVAKITWTEAKGKFFGSGFLAKITLGVEDRLGFFTAGHNLYDKGTKQLVKFSSVQLRFKDIQKQTKKVALSKFLGQKHVLIVAYKTCKIISRNGQESTQPCQKGLDFGAVIFTAPVNSAAQFLTSLGLSYLQVASPGACSSAPTMPVQLVGFPQYIENSPMRILPGNELEVPPGNIPDHCYDMETETGASGGSVLDKAGKVIAVHIRGQNITKGDQGNWGLGFDIIRGELQLCLNIPCLASQAQPGTSDPHKTQDTMTVRRRCTWQMATSSEESMPKGKFKEQMEKEREREKDLLENIDANMFIKGLDSYTDAVEREEITFNVEIKDPNAPVDFYINGKKVFKSDTRCKYVNVGEGKHQLILHNIKMEDMGTIEARSPSNRGDEMLTSSTEFEVAMGEHAPESSRDINVNIMGRTAASNGKMSCGVIIVIIGIIVIAVIAQYYKGGCNGGAHGIACCGEGFTTGDNVGSEEMFIQADKYQSSCSETCKSLYPLATGVTESLKQYYASGSGKNRKKCWCEFGDPIYNATNVNYQTCVFSE